MHYYDELGTLKLINVLINPAVAFGYVPANGGIASNYPRSAPPAMAGWRRRLAAIAGNWWKRYFPALRAADNTPRRESILQLVTTILTARSEAEYSSTRYKLA